MISIVYIKKIGALTSNSKKQSNERSTAFPMTHVIIPHCRVMPFYKPANIAGWVLATAQYLSSTDSMRPDIAAVVSDALSRISFVVQNKAPSRT